MSKEALKDLNKAIEINEEYVKAYMKRAEIHMKNKDFEEAARDYERVK